MSNKVLAADAGAERERERRESRGTETEWEQGGESHVERVVTRWQGSQVELEGLAAPANSPILYQRDLNYIDVPVSFLSNHKQDPRSPTVRAPPNA